MHIETLTEQREAQRRTILVPLYMNSTLKLIIINTYVENMSYLHSVCPCPDSPWVKGISRHNEDQVWTCKYMKLSHQGSINHTLLVGDMDYSVHRKQYQNKSRSSNHTNYESFPKRDDLSYTRDILYNRCKITHHATGIIHKSSLQ